MAETGPAEGWEAAGGWGDDEPGPPRLRLSRRGVVVLSALGALLLGGLGWLVFFSSALDVRAVDVQGLESGQLTNDQVAAALGDATRGPLARVDLAAAERRVEAVPRVAKAEIWRGWPHTLRVKLVERKAVAAVKAEDGKFTQVDAEGVSFATESAPPAGVPVVELALSQQTNQSLGVIPRPTLVRAAVTVAAGLPEAVAKRAGAVRVYSYDDIELQLSDGVLVRWGSAERTDRKAKVLTALLGQKATNYDVSAPEAPAVSS
ncbi:Cell division protein FtsQ [Kitasatospora sp. MMS16-BH015]|uniref:cell division protein FtsQ/DivIB n=1 Tax=Kitasatospora sp. MMS16-BH015 TaxID=2018025 RepID=UPI000CA1770B|nr:FtsQ-type POTRA domain-containing protein [Kitasatospora sp. MMS16-BH015]AUG76727.1 Cell division protein FtsQ [Kitasatospora sp. MMS16-BH015]